MPENLQEIIESLQSPEFEIRPPLPKPLLGNPITVIGSQGLRVTQSMDGEDMSVALANRTVEIFSDEEPLPVTDPLANMAFRCSFVAGGDGSILVKEGFVSYVYWDGGTPGTWIHDNFTIPEETVSLTGIPTYPIFFYLVVPVVDVTVTSDDATGPYRYFDGSGSPSTIEGNLYDFFAEVATSWKALDPTPPASYFLATDTPPVADSTHFRLLLAYSPSLGQVQQKTFGDVKLPQAYIANITSQTVSPH